MELSNNTKLLMFSIGNGLIMGTIINLATINNLYLLICLGLGWNLMLWSDAFTNDTNKTSKENE